MKYRRLSRYSMKTEPEVPPEVLFHMIYWKIKHINIQFDSMHILVMTNQVQYSAKKKDNQKTT